MKKQKSTAEPKDALNDFLINTLQIGVTSEKTSNDDILVEIMREGCLIGQGWLSNIENFPLKCPECNEERGLFYDVNEPDDGIQVICLSQNCLSLTTHLSPTNNKNNKAE